MKRNLITLLIVSFTIHFSYSQITISADDVFSKGNYKLAIDTSTNVSIGSSGTSKTWNFSNLKKHESRTSIVAPYSSNDPKNTANLVLIEDGDTSILIKKTNSNIKILFEAEDEYLQMNYFNFPLTYLSTSSDSIEKIFVSTGDDFGLPLLDSVRQHFITKIKTECDAWGSITIPSGTYNALRINYKFEIIDWAEGKIGNGSYYKIPNNEFKSSSSIFLWITNGKGFPIAIYDTSEKEFTYYESGILSNKFTEISVSNDLIVVNPVNENIIIKNNGGESYKLILTDICGKQIFEKEINADEELTQDASSLLKGTYILNVINKQSGKSSYIKLIK
ncbi:MAG: T9SS type A sorting domain-containing protein [Bacteroidia bacterium]|nr:T9SS type A sorting domain-containing protein [Bacteroidia bacterium]